MKIISNKIDKDDIFPKRVDCEYCGSTLEYDKSDIIYGDYGFPYLKCPACDKEFLLWDEKNLDFNEKQINYPQYFAHTTSEDAFSIPDKEVNRIIEDCIQRTKDYNSHISYTGVGDTYVFVIRDDDGYEVIVTKDYYDMIYSFKNDGGDDDGE